MIDYILQIMDEIEKNKPLSDSHEVNGRYVFPERWILLRRRLLRIGAEVFTAYETPTKSKEIPFEDMQKIVDANEKLVKEMRYGSK